MLTPLLLLALGSTPALPLALAVPCAVPCAMPRLVQDGGLEQAARLVDQGRLEEAAEQLNALLKGGEADARAVRLMLAEVQVAAGDAPSAIETLDSLARSEDSDVARMLGSAYAAWADQLAAEGASDDDVRMMRADARAQLERAAGLAPDGDLRARVQLGNLMLYRFGEHEAVIAMADAALAAHPRDGELLLLRGCAGVYRYWNAKQAGEDGAAAADAAWQRSVEDLRAAAAVLPRGRLEPWGQLVWLHEDKGDAVGAVEAAIAIVERDPEANFDTLYRLAVRYSYERAFEASGKALETMVGLSARELTRRLAAEEDVDAVATELGWSIDPYVSSQDLATARAILSAIVAAGPTNPVIWDNYAVMCQQTARYEDAVSAYERLLGFESVDPRAYNDLGAVLQYDLERDLDRARELYRTCIAKAESELAGADLTDARRAHLQEAIGIARDNLQGTDTRGGLLGGFLDALDRLKPPSGSGAGPAAGDAGTSDGGQAATEPESEGA